MHRRNVQLRAIHSGTAHRLDSFLIFVRHHILVVYVCFGLDFNSFETFLDLLILSVNLPQQSEQPLGLLPKLLFDLHVGVQQKHVELFVQIVVLAQEQRQQSADVADTLVQLGLFHKLLGHLITTLIVLLLDMGHWPGCFFVGIQHRQPQLTGLEDELL